MSKIKPVQIFKPVITIKLTRAQIRKLAPIKRALHQGGVVLGNVFLSRNINSKPVNTLEAVYIEQEYADKINMAIRDAKKLKELADKLFKQVYPSTISGKR